MKISFAGNVFSCESIKHEVNVFLKAKLFSSVCIVALGWCKLGGHEDTQVLPIKRINKICIF